MKAADPGLLLRSLRRPLAKVCGLRTLADVEAAAKAGADLVGIVVASPGSPREVPPAQAKELVQAARRLRLRAVLVTRSADLAAVHEACRLARPDFVQMHGVAPPDWVDSLSAFQGKVLFARGPNVALPSHGAGLVLDSAEGGGSGRVHDWDAAASANREGRRLTLVAGGLHAGNAAEAVRRSGAWGADASSGLESSPGVKDPRLIDAFVQAVRSA